MAHGLNRRDKYEEVIGYITGDKKYKPLKAPDRFYKNLRESLDFTNLLDNEGFGFNDIKSIK